MPILDRRFTTPNLADGGINPRRSFLKMRASFIGAFILIVAIACWRSVVHADAAPPDRKATYVQGGRGCSLAVSTKAPIFRRIPI
jgi:hypothetical protein